MDKTDRKSHVESEVGASIQAKGGSRRRTPPLIDAPRARPGEGASTTGPPRSLAAFLHMLAQEHLDDVAAQLPDGVEPTKGEPDRRQQVMRIVEHVTNTRDAKLVLHRAAETRSIRLGPHRTYYIGHARTNPWQTSPTETAERVENQMEAKQRFKYAPTGYAFGLDVTFESRVVPGTPDPCALPNTVYTAVLADLTIPDDTTVVVDLQSLRVEGELTMGRNARLFGLDPCGLRLRVGTLRGEGDGLPMNEWPMISTSIGASDSQLFALELDEDVPGMATGTGVNFVAHGEAGADGDDADPAFVKGEDGVDGFCAWPESTGATDGGDVKGDLEKGDAGEPGTDGLNARRLTIHADRLEGRVRFSAAGGDGGQGGKGGKGQGGRGGAGGMMPFGCAWAGDPGEGGTVERGGDGGPGGAGGNGGDASGIELELPDIASNAEWRACVRGGRRGVGGTGGWGGETIGGVHGVWIGTPQQWGTFQRADVGPNGAKGADGAHGTRGWNGSIRFNGQLVVAENDGDDVADYRYPADTTTGVADGCWDTTPSTQEPDSPGFDTVEECVCVDGPVDTAVVLTGPPNDALLTSGVALTWQADPHVPVGCVGGYHVHVRRSGVSSCNPEWSDYGTGMQSPDCFIADTNATSYAPTGLQSGQEYEWRVRGLCSPSSGEIALLGPWSDWRRFVVP